MPVAEKLAAQIVKQLPKQALTHGVVYPIVQTVAKHLGVQMSKGIFAKGVAEAIPVVGGVFSGGLTLATFLPMAKRLRKHLAALEIAKAAAQPAPRIRRLVRMLENRSEGDRRAATEISALAVQPLQPLLGSYSVSSLRDDEALWRRTEPV